MQSHLKVKVYTLAAEMSFIHRQEIKWKARAKAARQRQKQHAEEKTANSILYAEKNFWSHRLHRLDLKSDARTNHLAYGFLKGRTYQEMEYISYGGIKGYNKEEPDWARIEEMVQRFTKDETDPGGIMQRFGEWRSAATAWFEGNPDRIKVAKAEREAIYQFQLGDAAYQKARAERNALAREIGTAAA